MPPKKIPAKVEVKIEVKESKQEISSATELVTLPTAGSGNCAFHAIFGEPSDGHKKIFCSDVIERRKATADAIKTRPDLRPFVVEGIQARVMEVREAKISGKITQVILGPAEEGLSKKYDEFIEYEKKISHPMAQSALEAKLSKNPTVFKCIQDITERGVNSAITLKSSLQQQFNNALNHQSNKELDDLIAKTPAVQAAVEQYNKVSHSEFDWNKAVSNEMIQEYAKSVEKPGHWLLSLELAIVAHVFGITVNYFSAADSSVQIFNPNQSTTVSVQFIKVSNQLFNSGHYERKGTQAERERLVPKILSSSSSGFSLSQSSPALPLSSPKNKAEASSLPKPVYPLLSANNLSTVSAAIGALPSSNRPDVYKMDHLLASGTRGAVYQLLVLLARLTHLLIQKTDFEAEVESKGVGNLDDICLAIKNPINQRITTVEAYQVKYYSKAITEDNFFEEKMHIGKFFLAWMALKNKNSNLSQKNLHCILYSNVELGGVLNQCVVNGRFSHDFINQTSMASSISSSSKDSSKNKINLFEKLFKETFSYSPKKDKKGKNILLNLNEKKEADRRLLFREFLGCLRFDVKQPDQNEVIKLIQKNLAQLLNQPPEQVFLSLYYATQEWFLREYDKYKVPKLTSQVMRKLLNDSFIRGHDMALLQGHSRATYARLINTCGGWSVPREELEELRQALGKPGTVALTGEKGIGKSGLVKQALAHYHEAHYLLLPAAGLVQDAELRKKLLQVFKKIADIRIVVIDGAELLLDLPELTLKGFLDSLRDVGRVLVFTMTTAAIQHPVFKFIPINIVLKPLPTQQIVTHFRELQRYQSIKPVMDLAGIPFYLDKIMQLIKQTGQIRFQDMAESSDLDDQLMQWVVQGQRASEVSARRLVWQQLSVKIASNRHGLSRPFELSSTLPGVRLLVADGILQDRDGCYRFSHDLLFEHGLLAFWSQKWQTAYAEGTTAAFWQQLPNQLELNGSMKVLEKWFLSHHSQLREDWLLCADTLVKSSCFALLLAVAILKEDIELLDQFLKKKQGPLPVLDGIAGYFSTTYVSLAIERNSARSLELLLNAGVEPHHPLAGELIKLYVSASTPGRAVYDQEQNSKDSEKSEDLGESEDSEGYDSFASRDDSDDSVERYSGVQKEAEHPPSPADKFIKNPRKYCFAGFDEEPGEINDNSKWVENPDYHQPPDYDRYYIHQVVMQNKADCLTVFIETYQRLKQPEVIQLQNEYNETPLHVGVLKKAYECVELLLEQNISIDIVDDWGETALHNAAYIGDIELIKILLKNGANPNLTNMYGLSPFHIALTHLNKEIADEFLQYGADLSLSLFQPYSEAEQESMHVADLFDEMFKDNNSQQDEMEKFVIDLIGLLNYGKDGSDFQWGNKLKNPDLKLRQKQLNQVETLMILIEHRAQLSEYMSGFDYYDEETELDYIINIYPDPSRLDDLLDYILDDPANITSVLEADGFYCIREDLLKNFFDRANSSQRENLKESVKELGDKDLFSIIGLDEEEDEEGDEENSDSQELSEQNPPRGYGSASPGHFKLLSTTKKKQQELSSASKEEDIESSEETSGASLSS